MKYDKKIVLVYGLGTSGNSAINFLADNGALLYAYDDKKSVVERATMIKNLTNLNTSTIDFAVISPGVDINSSNINFLKEKGVHLKSELELGLENLKARLFCITGTNGKTTCVNLLNSIFLQAGKNSKLFGNVGTPVTSVVKEMHKGDYAVCEVSSFQMETTTNISSFASVLLNVAQDHLNRHKTMENYIALKLKLLNGAKYKVFNADDEISYNLSKNYSNAILFSKHGKVNGAYIKDNFVCYKKEKIINVNEINLLGDKNLENVLACITLAKLGKIKNGAIKKAIINFKPLKHRLELVDVIDDVMFVDDSKSTNISSTLCALQAFKNKNIILMLGGRGKNLDFSPIFENKLSGVVCFGECGLEILSSAKAERIAYEENLSKAFFKAYEMSRPGSVVLLSPACASFDEFTSYKQRGDYFASLVRKLKMGD